MAIASLHRSIYSEKRRSAPLRSIDVQFKRARGVRRFPNRVSLTLHLFIAAKLAQSALSPFRRSSLRADFAVSHLFQL